MNAIVSIISLVFKFFKWGKVVDFFFRSITFAKMLIVNLALASVFITYVYAISNLISFVYDKFNAFIKLVDNLSSNGSNETLSWAMDVVKSFGVWNAFVDTYDLFSGALISLFVIYASKLFIKFLRNIQLSLVSFSISKL